MCVQSLKLTALPKCNIRLKVVGIIETQTVLLSGALLRFVAIAVQTISIDRQQ